MDARSHGFLDFAGFQRFMKLLKTRPEFDWLYKKLCVGTGGDAHNATQLPLDLVRNEKQGPTSTADASPSASPPYPAPPRADATMSLEAFTSFLLSPDNSVFGDSAAGWQGDAGHDAAAVGVLHLLLAQHLP
ncbi:hypothetical protein OF83DRAFT_1186106, partial [Amylostereum chailletii]